MCEGVGECVCMHTHVYLQYDPVAGLGSDQEGHGVERRQLVERFDWQRRLLRREGRHQVGAVRTHEYKDDKQVRSGHPLPRRAPWQPVAVWKRTKFVCADTTVIRAIIENPDNPGILGFPDVKWSLFSLYFHP